MDILYNFGIEEKEICNMIEQTPEIKDLSSNEIEYKIYLLKELGCSDNHIRNILVSNPYYLNRLNSDIIKLINKLLEFGFTCINILLDSNPYILNKDAFEIENYINNRIQNNELLEDIVDDLDSNTYKFDDI